MGRSRGGRFSDRPANLELSTKGTTTYFFYVFPDRRRRSLGADKAKAYSTAAALNAHFANTGVDVVKLLATPVATIRDPAFSKLVDEFRRHFIAQKKLQPRTRDEIEIKLRFYLKQWGADLLSTFDTLKVSTFLNTLTASAYVKHRALLLNLFQYATHSGYKTSNPVTLTLIKKQDDKKRQRLTAESYIAIREAAPDWLQRAMDVALFSLQRRHDITSLTRSQVDLERNTVTLVQHKTENYAKPIHIEIVMGSELRRAIEACMRSSVPCPFLIHARPERMTAQARKAKAHPFAVLPQRLTKAFAAARDAAGIGADLAPEQRPTFHELRSLGIHLYGKAGCSNVYVMALSGHVTEAMLKHYQEGHQVAGPRRVEAGVGTIIFPGFPENSRKIPGN